MGCIWQEHLLSFVVRRRHQHLSHIHLNIHFIFFYCWGLTKSPFSFSHTQRPFVATHQAHWIRGNESSIPTHDLHAHRLGTSPSPRSFHSQLVHDVCVGDLQEYSSLRGDRHPPGYRHVCMESPFDVGYPSRHDGRPFLVASLLDIPSSTINFTHGTLFLGHAIVGIVTRLSY